MRNPIEREPEPPGEVWPFARRLAEEAAERTGFFEDRAFQTALRASLAVLLVVGTVALVFLTWGILKPLLVAVVLATMLWPWVSRIADCPIGPRHWRVPRVLAVALIYLVSVVAAGAMVWLVLSSLLPWLDKFMAAYPQQTAFLHAYLDPFRGGDVAKGAVKVAGEVAKQSSGAAQTAAQSSAAAPPGPVNVGALALGLFGGLVTTLLVLIFTFFLLLEGGHFAQWAILLLPRERRPTIRATGLRIRDRVSRWVLATAIYATVSGTIVGTAMWLLGIPSPWFFAAGAALLALIPGVGPASITILAVLVALDLATWQIVAVAAFGIVLYIADAAFIAPKIFGDMLRLPMFVVFLAILLGGALLGVWGAILALPIAATVQIVLREARGKPPLEAG